MYCENKRCILYQETSLVPTIVGDYKKVTNNNNSDNVSFFYLTNLLLDRWDPHTCSVSADLDAIICLSNYSFLCRVFYLASPIPYICPEHTFWVTANQSLQDEINASKAHVSIDTKLWNFRSWKGPEISPSQPVLWSRTVLKFFATESRNKREKFGEGQNRSQESV